MLAFAEMTPNIGVSRNGAVDKKKWKKRLPLNKENGFHPKATTTHENVNTQATQLEVQANPDDVPLWCVICVYISYLIVGIVTYVTSKLSTNKMIEKYREDYPSIYNGLDGFNRKYLVHKVSQSLNNPICSVPRAKFQMLDRVTDDFGRTWRLTGTKSELLNVSSYNYLGFAENRGDCHDEAEHTTIKEGFATCSPIHEIGKFQIHNELESIVADFVGQESAICFGMGFATNSLNLPSLLDKDCLVLSDQFNHASLALGMRLSGATIKVFKHNDMKDLESLLREGIVYGNRRRMRSYSKILIVVEGIYSMEGTICDLPSLVQLKKKYKAYLYVDEAHSIGALGARGRGVCDYFNIDPREIDILMGTFSKSFGAAGGYISGRKELIDHLRVSSHAQHYASSFSPTVARQVITSMEIIMGRRGNGEGLKRVRQLASNSKFFRRKLEELGFVVFGHRDSPVVPVCLYMPGPMEKFSGMLIKRKVSSVVVGFPICGLFGSRIRFCISSALTKEMLDEIIEHISDAGDITGTKFRAGEPTSKTFEC